MKPIVTVILGCMSIWGVGTNGYVALTGRHGPIGNRTQTPLSAYRRVLLGLAAVPWALLLVALAGWWSAG